MSFLGFLLLGLIAGAIAKLILPGKQGGGWFITLLLGVVGALLGGWLGSLILNRPLTEFWDLGTWLLAIGGSIIVLLIYGLIAGRGRRSTTDDPPDPDARPLRQLPLPKGAGHFCAPCALRSSSVRSRSLPASMAAVANSLRASSSRPSRRSSSPRVAGSRW